MINVGAPELMLILLVALIVLGPAKLPDAARQLGRAVSELRRVSSGFQAELRDAMQEPMDGMPSLKPSDILSEPAPKPKKTATAPPGDGAHASDATDPTHGTGGTAANGDVDSTAATGDTPPAPDTGTNGSTPH